MPDCAECAFAALSRISQVIDARLEETSVGSEYEGYISLKTIQDAFTGEGYQQEDNT